MTPDQLVRALSPRSVVATALRMPGGPELRELIQETVRAGHVVVISADVVGPGVAYRFTPARMEEG